MKKYHKIITVYELDGGFFLEVSKQDGLVNFYLHHKNYAVKKLMFGLYDFYGMTEEEIIRETIDEYIADYKEEYFEGLEF